jgi:hypothetical protein
MSAAARKFDPANDQHYALSETSQLVLKQASDAMHGLASAFQDGLHEDMGDHYVGALFGSFAFLIEAVLDDQMVFRPRAK